MSHLYSLIIIFLTLILGFLVFIRGRNLLKKNWFIFLGIWIIVDMIFGIELFLKINTPQGMLKVIESWEYERSRIIVWDYKDFKNKIKEIKVSKTIIEICLRLIEKFPDTEESAHAYQKLGETFNPFLGWDLHAFKAFEKAKTLFEKFGDKDYIRDVEIDIKWCCIGKTREQAKQDYISLIEKSQGVEKAYAHDKLGQFYADERNYAKALEEFQKAKEIYKKLEIKEGVQWIEEEIKFMNEVQKLELFDRFLK